MSEEQSKKEVTVLYRNFTPEIASDIIKLNLSEEAEKTLNSYLRSGDNYTGHWWTELWVNRTLYNEWMREATRKIDAFQNHPKEALEIYTNKAYCDRLGIDVYPEKIIEQAREDLKRYEYYLDNIKEIIEEIERRHLDPWRIAPDSTWKTK